MTARAATPAIEGSRAQRQRRDPRLPLALATLAVAALAVALTVAPGAAAGSPRPDSGIVGVLRPAAECPLPGVRVSQRRPWAAVVRVYRADGRALVATVPVTPLGVFRVRLRPGTYALRAGASRLPRPASPRVVRVRPHAFTPVVLRAGSSGC